MTPHPQAAHHGAAAPTAPSTLTIQLLGRFRRYLGPSTAATVDNPRRWFVALLIGWLLQVAWRLWFARNVNQPVAHPDESSYLLVARLLAGGPESTITTQNPLRQMGYPAVLTPLYFFVHDHVAVFRGPSSPTR